MLERWEGSVALGGRCILDLDSEEEEAGPGLRLDMGYSWTWWLCINWDQGVCGLGFIMIFSTEEPMWGCGGRRVMVKWVYTSGGNQFVLGVTMTSDEGVLKDQC